MHIKRISIWVLFVSIILVSGCEGRNPLTYQSDQCDVINKNNLAIKQKADTLIHFFAPSHPDSAIYYSLQLIGYFDSIGCSHLIFDSYFYLSEIFLYQKSNDYLATFYYTQGLNLMLQNNIEFNLNPFYLIDLGNILYRHRLYQHAIINYKNAGANARKLNHKYAEAVALNNIGLCFQKTHDYDSSAQAFRSALEIRKNIMPLLEAQNHLYLAKLFMETGFTDSVSFHKEKMALKLDRQIFTNDNMHGMSLENAVELSNEISVEKELLEAEYLMKTNDEAQFGLAENSFKKAAHLATKYKKPLLLAQILTLHAETLLKTGKLVSSIPLILKAFGTSLEINDLKNASELCKTAAKVYSQLNKPLRENLWMQRAILYSDSLFKLENSDQFLADKILLLTAQTERELQNSRIILAQNKVIIRNQKRSITVLISSVATILAFLGVVLFQRKKLNEAYHALVARTMQIIETEKRNYCVKTNLISSEHSSVLLHQLEHLMNTGDHFLDPDLSISKLSKLLGTNEKYLSQLFNHQLNTTFNDYINALRIKEACRMLTETKPPLKSLEQIALEAGFRSRSTFYQAFKKCTGVTPAFFQKNATNNTPLLS